MQEFLMVLTLIGVGFGALLIIVFLAVFAMYFRLWLRAYFTRVWVSPFTLLFMSLRKVNPNTIIDAKVMAVQAGLKDVSIKQLESHYLAEGNVLRVVRALIAAHRAKITLDWNTAAAIDLAGRDVLEAVNTSVNPKVIDCPDPTKGSRTLDAVARNGIQLKVKARVTVRTKLERLVGGATEETIVARVGQGIVSAIGSANDHWEVLANPAIISREVLNKGLDSATAFDIVSIDIADVEVGENVGANLQAAQAQADLKVANARAEERRAAAVARAQEMKALVEENRAKVVLAEAEVPQALAYAIKNNKMGVMDFYGMRNLMADTEMRKAIAETDIGSTQRQSEAPRPGTLTQAE